MHKDKERIVISERSTLRETMLAMDQMPLGIIVLVDEKRCLKGVVTDGDLRRAIATGSDIDSPVSAVMNRNPVKIRQDESNHRVLRLFNERIRQIPVVDEGGSVVDVLLYSDYLKKSLDSKRAVTVRACAPLRVSFAGGGTDIDNYIRSKTGAVLSTTIKKYFRGTLVKREDSQIIINSLDFKKRLVIASIDDIKYDGEVDLIKAVIKLMRPEFGMDLYLQSDVPPRSGLGGSSSAAVAVAGLLNYFREEKLDDYQIAEIAFQAERVELGIGGGWQDQYAAVFGGLNFMEFRDKDVFIHPLRLKQDLINELESSLILFYTGQTRVSEANAGQTSPPVSPQTEAALDRTRELTLEMRNYLLKGDLSHFGELLHTLWEIKKVFAGKITNAHIDDLYRKARENGAWGGKVLGAEGGGYLLVICPPLVRHKIMAALTEAGAKNVDISFDTQGLQTWAARSQPSPEAAL